MQTVEVCGEGTTEEKNVRKWCRIFKEGRTNTHGEERNGRAVISSGNFSTILHTHTTNLAPSNYHLFLHLKRFLAGQSLRRDQKIKDVIQGVQKNFSATFLYKASKS